MNKIVKNTLILTTDYCNCRILSWCWYHEITKTPIAQAQETAEKEAWQAVFPDAKLDEFKAEDVDQKCCRAELIRDLGVNATIDEVCTAGDAAICHHNNRQRRIRRQISRLQLVFRKTVRSTVYLFLSISETAGLGMKATEAVFL